MIKKFQSMFIRTISCTCTLQGLFFQDVMVFDNVARIGSGCTMYLADFRAHGLRLFNDGFVLNGHGLIDANRVSVHNSTIGDGH